MNPNEEQKKAVDGDWIEYALRQLQEQYKFNPEQAELQIETCARFFRSQVASREQQAAENAARVIEGIPKTFLDHKEDGRREYNLDEQRAYNRAVFDISKAIRSAAAPFLNPKGE